MNIPQGAQEYLEAIFEMEEEGGPIAQARIAKRLGVSRATVSEYIKRLEREKFIDLDGRHIALNSTGRDVATPLVRRHRLAERLLTDILEIPWHRAHEMAHDWEHIMTPEVEDKILTKTGSTTCPHGNPIPGQKPPYDRAKLIPLTDLGDKNTGTLCLLTEDVELVTDVLRYFEEHGLMPGASIKVASVAPDGTLMLEVDGKPASLGASLADNVWVMPGGSGA
ncbi:MAG: metal-dependent transcriptional regulator [Actinomycetota bacterium]|nr:metal-dependent transcriptional regulator [Actinomycetota bacterium]